MKKRILLLSITIFSSVLLYKNTNAELLAIEQYLSIKTGYTGIFIDPLTIKGTNIVPSTGVTSNRLLSSPNLSLAVGTYYATPYVAIRGEAEYAIRFATDGQIKDIKLPGNRQANYNFRNTVQTALLNLYLDFNTTTFFVPYIGVGLGAAFIENRFSLANNTNYNLSINFSWMATAGAAFYIIPSVALDIQVRYASFGSSNHGTGDPVRQISTQNAVEALIGIRYTL